MLNKMIKMAKSLIILGFFPGGIFVWGKGRASDNLGIIPPAIFSRYSSNLN